MTTELRTMRVIAAVIVCWVVAILICALTPSCAHIRPGTPADKAVPPGAVSVAWASYGRTDAPPDVRVVIPNCTDADGRGGVTCGGKCAQGCTLDPLAVTIVDDDANPLNMRPLCHEMIHAWQARQGVADPFHRTTAWGEPLTACKAALAAAGY